MKTKKWKEKYNEISQIGKGGNALVYKVSQRSDGLELFALKELTNLSSDKKQRFKCEIEVVLQEQNNCSGILPIYEHAADNDSGFWYTMPLAQPLKSVLSSKSLADTVKAIIELAQTLKELHDKAISHRDIKPDNIFYFNEHYCFGDFGLVSYPEGENLTKTESHLGAWATMAPEMRRDPKNSDGTKADVYSLAKTLWMLITKNDKGFDGEYSFLNQSVALRKNDFKESLVDIEELLVSATKNNPEERPDINLFCERLEKWLKEKDDWELTQQKEWAFIIKQLFIMPADRASWTSRDDIIKILNIIGKTHSLSHLFLPDGGGLDFDFASKAFEDECIFIFDNMNTVKVLKPKKLSLECFEANSPWNYFFLEAAVQSQIRDSNTNSSYEFLAALPNGKYIGGDGIMYGVYNYDNGKKLPVGYKLVNRYCKGNFLLVMKSSPYNGISATYDARHNNCDGEQFRKYIETIKNNYDPLISKGITPKAILNSKHFSKNPFKNEDNYRHQQKKHSLNELLPLGDFIKENYINWDFSSFIDKTKQKNSSPARFFITFNLSTDGSSFPFGKLIGDNYCVFMDGKIRKTSLNYNKIQNVISEILFFTSRKKAMAFCKKCERQISNILKEKDCSKNFGTFFIPELQRNLEIKPSHLFTKSEIEQLMHDADDRRYNRLVINENGYAKMIQENDNPFLYPVRNSQWDAGNQYVGRYSDLSDLDRTYEYCLWGWLDYLECGESIYTSNCHSDESLETVLEKIGSFYREINNYSV